MARYYGFERSWLTVQICGVTNRMGFGVSRGRRENRFEMERVTYMVAPRLLEHPVHLTLTVKELIQAQWCLRNRCGGRMVLNRESIFASHISLALFCEARKRTEKNMLRQMILVTAFFSSLFLCVSVRSSLAARVEHARTMWFV